MKRRTPAAAASATSERVASRFTARATSGSAAQAGSPTIAARWTTFVGAVERRRAGAGVADVAADELHAGVLELGGEVLLPVEQAVEHDRRVAGLEELPHGGDAEVARAPGDERAGRVGF